MFLFDSSMITGMCSFCLALSQAYSGLVLCGILMSFVVVVHQNSKTWLYVPGQLPATPRPG